MAIKDWLNSMTSAAGRSGTRSGSSSAELTVDDLITLERYEEALSRLKRKIKKNRKDYRSRILLADVYLKMKQSPEAIEEYLSVADQYAAEGFFDKGYALVAKLARMLPHEEKLQAKMSALRRAKRLEHRRHVVISSLGTRTWAMEVGQHWNDLIHGPLVEVLSQAQLTKIFPLLEIERLEEGDVLVERGSSKHVAFVILTGELSAQVQLESGADADLRSFHGGDLIGETALLKRDRWAATYRAKTACKVLTFNREALEKALVGEEDPRGFLNALRLQGNDAEVAASVSKLSVAPQV